MNLRRPGAWQRVLALAPLLLLLVSLPSQVLLRCRMDGHLRDSCCCPREQPSQAPAAAAADCCRPETSVRQVPAARAPEPGDAAAAPVTRIVTLAPPPVAAPRMLRPLAPAREGPPLLLLKQAFLI